MANAGFFGIGLLAYASWQTIHFLSDRAPRVWARQRYHKYLPRPTSESLKQGKHCSHCSHYITHPDFTHSGICNNEDWKAAMRSDEIMVKKQGSCELFQKISPRLQKDKELFQDRSLFSESASEYSLHSNTLSWPDL